MGNNVEMIRKIRLFGLNTYEAKMWFALLSRSVSTAGELSDISNVPRSRSYDVLQSLEKKGFVEAKPYKPIKYFTIQPKDVLKNIKNKIKRDRDNYINYISSDTFKSLINNFQEMYEKNTDKDENMTAILKGRKNIHKHLDFLVKNSKKSKIRTVGIGLCLVDDNDALLFPLQEKDIHPDYDFCVWIKNGQTAKFLSGLISFA